MTRCGRRGRDEKKPSNGSGARGIVPTKLVHRAGREGTVLFDDHHVILFPCCRHYLDLPPTSRNLPNEAIAFLDRLLSAFPMLDVKIHIGPINEAVISNRSLDDS